jgi:hypothetical protein
MAYIVIKTIRGRRYKYWQRAWREGNRVRTQCRCLGRIDGDVGSNVTLQEMTGLEAVLRRDGVHYETADISVHFTEGVGFWVNRKGYESAVYKSLAALIKRHPWVGEVRTGANTTAAASNEAWRTELQDGLHEVMRRLRQEGNHYVVEQIRAIDVERSSRASLLQTLRGLNKDWEGDSYAGEHLTETIARLAAFGNATADSREAWRDTMAQKLGVAETWMPTKELQAAVRTIIERAGFGSPENVITWLERLDALVDDSGQARKHLRGMIEYVRNTTGTHTDASLIEMLFTAEPEGAWQQPWRDGGVGRRTTLVGIDPRVLGAPLQLGVTVKTQPFGQGTGMLPVADPDDGAWYAPSIDTIQMPDAARYRADTKGIAAAEFYEHNLLHETCHAAWHPSRLNGLRSPFVDGRHGYAANEVITEIAACLTERKLGMKRPALWRAQVRYIRTWFERAKLSDTQASELRADALKVADYVCSKIIGNTAADTPTAF